MFGNITDQILLPISRCLNGVSEINLGRVREAAPTCGNIQYSFGRFRKRTYVQLVSYCETEKLMLQIYEAISIAHVRERIAQEMYRAVPVPPGIGVSLQVLERNVNSEAHRIIRQEIS